MSFEFDVRGSALGFPSVPTPASFVHAIGHFQAASIGNDPLLHAAMALRSALLAVCCRAHKEAGFDPAKLREVANDAFRPLAIAEPDAPQFPDILVGYRAFCGLMSHLGQAHSEHPDLLRDVVDKIAIAANELDSMQRRRDIAARGHAFDRAVAIASADIAEPGPTVQ